MTEEDLTKDWEDWSVDKKPEKLQGMLVKLTPTIEASVNTYVGPKASQVIKDRARIIAAKAIKKYNPKAGAKLHTFVASNLRELQRSAPVINEPFVAPEKFRQDSHILHKANKAFIDSFGREPTDEELSEAAGLPLKRVFRVRNRNRPVIHMSALEGDEDSPNQDIVGQRRRPYDDWLDAVYHDLGDIDKLILQYRTGYGGVERLPNEAIALRAGLSPAAVSQRAAKIQAMLDQFHD
jgi:DNA-directed RNA polymerase specialized sigma subunit